MKRLFIAVALLLSGCASAKPPMSFEDHAVTLTWSQSFANNGICSTTVTTSCISGFNEGYVIGTTQTQLNTASPSACTGTTQPENCSSAFNAVLPIGNVVFYVATTYIDQNGTAGVTASALSPAVLVPADKPVNLGAVVGP
jgi:hypothetical protein